MEQAKKKKAEDEWSNDEHRNGLFLSWRLRLRTSGIYRSCHPRLLAVTDWAGYSRPRPGLAPESALRLHQMFEHGEN
jgi:hypothetical protein